MSAAPIVKAFIACQKADRRKDGSYDLTGVSTAFSAKKYPQMATLVFYLHVTEIYGPAEFRIEVSDAETGSIGMWGNVPEREGLSPLDVAVDAITIPNFEIPKRGEYFVNLLWQGQSLADLRLSFS